MAFFSEDLSFTAVCKNTIFGVKVLVGEWRWLIKDFMFNLKIKQLNKKLATASDRQEIQHEIATLTIKHQSFRDFQISDRVKNI